MKILYDHQAFKQVFGGVSRYYVETLKRLNPEIEIEVAIKYSNNLYIKEFLPQITNPFGNLYVPFKRGLVNKANWNYAISRLKNSDYNLFHATFDDSYFLAHVKTPFVISVHDLIPESEPELWPGGWLESRKIVFPKASHIIVNSIKTKTDLLSYHPDIEERNISVIYRGYTLDNFHLEPNKNGKYILYVGGRKGYKNFSRFIKACAPILNEYSDLKLICTGDKFTKEEKHLFVELKVENKITQKTVNEFELNHLYKNAILFVFPSIKEGFGLPILEAWGNKCPVLLSDTDIFKEIAQDAAEYFNPLSIEDIQRALDNLLININLRNDLIAKGYVRVKLFTWEKSTREHELIYKQVARQ